MGGKINKKEKRNFANRKKWEMSEKRMQKNYNKESNKVKQNWERKIKTSTFRAGVASCSCSCCSCCCCFSFESSLRKKRTHTHTQRKSRNGTQITKYWNATPLATERGMQRQRRRWRTRQRWRRRRRRRRRQLQRLINWSASFEMRNEKSEK